MCKIVPWSLKLFLFEHRFIYKKNSTKKILNTIRKENDNQLFSIFDEKDWLHKFIKLTYSDKKLIKIGESFFSDNIIILRDLEINFSDIVAICVAKNDLIKIKKFIAYHRKLGIDKFIFLDNNSIDGSIEYLLKQKDVILLQTVVPYSSYRRVAWINRIISHYGYNRWYFVADSDELLAYSNCENKSIKDLIKMLEERNIKCARALMIDMYANKEYYKSGNKDNYYEKCIYFDADTYMKHNNVYFNRIYGGPRARIFDAKPCLTKYPLFYFEKNDLFRTHFMYPYKKNLNIDCNLILKHYKFLPGEISKVKNIVSNENYYNNSDEYKKYFNYYKKNKYINFFCGSTCKYIDSSSLDNIKFYDKIDWK